MNENPVFQSIRNHQEPAPDRIMNNAILASKRKRFFAFQWHTMNAWYVGLIMALSAVFFANHQDGVSKETRAEGVITNSTLPEAVMMPAATTDVKSSITAAPAPVTAFQQYAVPTKRSNGAENVSMPESAVQNAGSSAEHVEINGTAQEVQATEMVETQALKQTEAQQLPTSTEEQVKENSNGSKSSKKKRLPVKVVQP
jgi:hypothetical protein